MLLPIIMELNTIDNNTSIDKCRKTLSDPYKLKRLIHKMQQALKTGSCIDFNSLERFSYNNTDRNNPFGYDLEKGNKLKYESSFYRANSLCHKLIRVQKEFKFVKRNIMYYQELTLREKEIIQLLSNGYNNPEIADQLFISRCTVEQHRKHINHKLHITSFPHLLKYSYSFNLI